MINNAYEITLKRLKGFAIEGVEDEIAKEIIPSYES